MKEMLADLRCAFDGNECLLWLARFSSLSMSLEVAGVFGCAVRIQHGSIEVEDGFATSSDLQFKLDAESWREYLLEYPRPGYQALYSMFWNGRLSLVGDSLTFVRHLLLIEQLFASLRATSRRGESSGQDLSDRIEPIVARYAHTTIGGRSHRIYFEEAGEGIPLICLHTAGADARQFRAILTDPTILHDFRVIAFDLPWHGKSSPPAGFQKEMFRLTTDFYMETVLSLIRILELENPVVMGCSIGGRAVLHLALRYGRAFRAVIGIESGIAADHPSLPGIDGLSQYYRLDIDGAQVAAAAVSSAIAPPSPDAERWETLWHYMQNVSGVFLGDMNYYLQDGDLRNIDIAGLSAGHCPVYMLTGEYDTPDLIEQSIKLAHDIKAAHFEVMRDVGHFPMSENPARFKEYLLPVLDKVRNL